jgi:hypothetical protein
MKMKYILVVLLLVALATTGTGYSVDAGSSDKLTGGGRFNSIVWGQYVGNKVSFNLQTYLSDGDVANGTFQLTNHDQSTKLKGSFSTYSIDTLEITLMGTCSIDGGASQDLHVLIREDAEPGFDKIDIWIGAAVGLPDYRGQVGKGNIQWHKAK